MIPVYFPFTYVSPATTARLARWFDELGILAPAANAPAPPGSASLAWHLYTPPPGDEALLDRLETEWRRWADQHAGADLAAVMAAREADGPFAAPPAISSLRSRIRAGAAGESAAPGDDPLRVARVFLRLAHALDQDQDALREQLHQVAELERRMHLEMVGQIPGDSPVSDLARDQDLGAVLAGRRLAAWARLAVALEITAEVFVTDSPAVMDALGERMGPLEPVSDLSPEETRQLPGALARAPASGPEAAAAKIYAVALSPAAFLHRLAVDPRTAARAPRGAGRCLLVAIAQD
jgi:hypothetical protein